MANASQLSLWILENAEEIKLKVTKQNWTSDWGFDYFDYTANMILEGNRLEGRGSSRDQTIAIEKVVTEGLERYLMHLYADIPYSNGLACHIDKILAKENAIKELIERDLFLCYFHASRPFIRLDRSEWDFFIPTKSKERLRLLGVDLDCFIMYKSNSIVSVLLMANGLRSKKKFGYVIGLGTKGTIKEAIEAASMELFRQLSFNLSQDANLESLKLQEFLSLHNPRFEDHGKLALNIEYAEQICFLFNNEESTKIQTYEPTLPFDITVRELFFNQCKILEQLPLFAAHATASSFQNLYTGYPENALNMKRLIEFNSGSFFTKLLVPHPLR